MNKSKKQLKFLPPSPTLRREIQDRYEGGTLTIAEIAARYAVDKRALEFWADRYGWLYGRRASLQRIQTVEEKLTEAARMGFGFERRLQKLIDGANVSEKSMETIITALKRMVVKGEEPDEEARTMVQQVVARYLDDKRLELSYMQELAKVLGDYAPVRRELTGKGGTPLLGGRSGETKTRQQMEEELLTLVRRLNNATKLGNAGSATSGGTSGNNLLVDRPKDDSVPPDSF